MQSTEAANDKTMKLRYAGSCRLCDATLEKGALAVYERASRTVRCVTCRPPVVVDQPGRDVGRTDRGSLRRPRCIRAA